MVRKHDNGKMGRSATEIKNEKVLSCRPLFITKGVSPTLKVADTPFHIQGEEVYLLGFSSST